MDIIIFGDDWGRHVSTTQHLASELAGSDRVIWVNSMGMRSPRLNRRDVRRVLQKMRMSRQQQSAERGVEGKGAPVAVINPKVIPWHMSKLVRAVNRMRFGRQMRKAISSFEGFDAGVVVTYPVPSLYLMFPHRGLVYLKLDEYTKLPGVDPEMVHLCENRLMSEADAVFITAEKLIPGEPLRQKTHYLPQGVDIDLYSRVPLTPARTKTLGFFGLLAEWLDYDLVRAVSRTCPDWTLEFIGPVRQVPEDVMALPNVCIRPPVAYRDLPEAISGWDAAWVPFQINSLTEGVNPLKLREYLAAGLPSMCTPLPEAYRLGDVVSIVKDGEDIERFLREVVPDDSETRRKDRRDSVKKDSWAARAAELREVLASISGEGSA
ncbi:MAG: hypothetical protein KJ626_11935 [Verrucomicrobia bacterium]|nr:hypothetical protein [Verrucomicrobiota bacterium]